MPGTTATLRPTDRPSPLDRAVSLFTDVRAGEGITVLLMLVNVFLLLVCYSVIKTVREPLVLLGGGAEVRSYAAAGQALLLIAFVPAYSRFAARVNRAKLLIGVTLFFLACIEIFAAAVAAGVPYAGVAFFVWVGIFNMSLVAQFWSFATDIYASETGERLFPVIMLGMTAGAPVGSLLSSRLFRLGFTPQVILQLSAALLAVTLVLYLIVNRRESVRNGGAEPLSAEGGFQLVLANPYLRLVALLVVILNVVNTTGEYLISRLLTLHVADLAAADAAFNRQAFIGAYAGDYQLWVNVTALALQAFVAARLVKSRGLAGVLLVMPLIAFGGYAVIAAGVGFSVMRWIKTAENAADYSVMNTARQLLWLPTTREEKYKAKQAIDTFFVRGGDVLSAAIVYTGTALMHLTVRQFAAVNVGLTVAWLGVAALILAPRRAMPRLAVRPLVRAAAVAVLVLAAATQASAQTTREEQLAAERADKAAVLHPYEPDSLERNVQRLEGVFMSPRSMYAFIGSAFDGGGLAVGPGYRKRFSDSGSFDAHAGISIRRFKTADALLTLPQLAGGRVTVQVHGNWLDAPSLAFFGIGNDSPSSRRDLSVRTTTIGGSARVQAARSVTFDAGVESVSLQMPQAASPSYARAHVAAEYDTRTSPSYTRSGGRYRIELSDYRQVNGTSSSFRRLDAEADRFIPILRENWVIALRALASTTDTAAGNTVPVFFLPDLGGSHTLRGYPTWRFRDRSRMLFTGEYRWTAGSFVDMALFMDAGKVASRFGDLNVRGLNRTYGIGMSLHTPNRTLARIEFARTREGNSLSMSFSPSF